MEENKLKISFCAFCRRVITEDVLEIDARRVDCIGCNNMTLFNQEKRERGWMHCVIRKELDAITISSREKGRSWMNWAIYRKRGRGWIHYAIPIIQVH